jgi:uncharacterized membrane protein YeiH
MFATVTLVLDSIGIVAFAITGALVASRKEMDIVGFALLGTVTGIGGGTIRDLLLGAPVFWVGKPGYLVACVVVSALVFSTAHLLESRFRVLLWLDAVGMALFAVVGAEIASLAGANGIVAITMGVITATFGGIIRDLLGGEVPIILSREIYASAALAGAASFVVLMTLVASRELALGVSFAVAFMIRAAALEFGWSLPRYRPRPARERDRS